MPNKLTTKEFIARAEKVHNGEYDYSNVVYVSAKIKVEIYCKEHDIVFFQIPRKHTDGQT